jgi:hypothetical protein
MVVCILVCINFGLNGARGAVRFPRYSMHIKILGIGKRIEWRGERDRPFLFGGIRGSCSQIETKPNERDGMGQSDNLSRLNASA